MLYDTRFTAYGKVREKNHQFVIAFDRGERNIQKKNDIKHGLIQKNVISICIRKSAEF